MLHPEPWFELSLLEHLIRIYYPLLENYQVPLIPNASNNSCPTLFHTRFCLLLAWLKWKLRKCIFKSLSWTKEIPIHLKHIYQTHCACLHSRKRCWHDSSFDWHIAHNIEFIITPLLFKHTLVGTLPSNTLQAVVNTFGNVLAFQRSLKTSEWGPLDHLTRHSYAKFMENNPGTSFPHTCTSLTSFFKRAPNKSVNRYASNEDSYSNLVRLHLRLHLHFDWT